LGHPCTMSMKTIQQDLKSSNLSQNEEIDVARNRPLWRLGMHARNDDDDPSG